jgi:hypothetical protein
MMIATWEGTTAPAARGAASAASAAPPVSGVRMTIVMRLRPA